jgi:hypothetical protein
MPSKVTTFLREWRKPFPTIYNSNAMERNICRLVAVPASFLMTGLFIATTSGNFALSSVKTPRPRRLFVSVIVTEKKEPVLMGSGKLTRGSSSRMVCRGRLSRDDLPATWNSRERNDRMSYFCLALAEWACSFGHLSEINCHWEPSKIIEFDVDSRRLNFMIGSIKGSFK